MSIKTFGDVDERSLKQLQRCLGEDGVAGVLCADHHLGYSQPIGGGVAYPNHISPSGVGYDIACGNKAVRTNLRVEDIVGTKSWRLLQGAAGETPPETATDISQGREVTPEGELKNEASVHAYSSLRPENALAGIMNEIVERVSFGMGRSNKEPVADHLVLDAIREAPFAPQRQLYDLAANQLGTVGAGNHYVDLFADEDDRVWIGVHFGSRGFGHKTASGFLALAQGKRFEERGNEGEMDSPPVLFSTDTDLGQSYLEAMHLAGEYAYAGRDWVVDRVLKILGTESDYEVHNHHNFAWREQHFGQDVWVIRKGCTPAFPDQAGFVGASMMEDAVILEGVESSDSEEAMYSTVHGAGRVMSRTKAAGKARTVRECSERECDFHVTNARYQVARQDAKVGEQDRFTLCPDHPEGRMKKCRRITQRGAIDWPATQRAVHERGIELRGGAADEAPGAYKRLDDVLTAHGDTIRILHRLRPIGVAMASSDTFDPFKD